MKLTTKDIITLLPFDQQFKTELLSSYDSFDQDRKFNITQILWRAYYALYTIKLQENLDLALLQAENDPEMSLDKDFYAKVKARTQVQMQALSVDSKISVSVEDAKLKLAQVLAG
jgi:hypothetical protein